MKRFTRSDRVAEELLKEISSIIRLEMKDPRIAQLTSITRVEVSKDLKNAKALVSVYGSEKEQNETIEALSRGAGFVRSVLGKRLRMRQTPAVVFRLDDSIERGAAIQKILKEVGAGEKLKESES